MTTLSDLKERLLTDTAVKEEYEKVEAEFRLIEALIKARMRARLSQEELAQRMGSTPSAVAKLESGRASPSVSTLLRYAEATGSRLDINLVEMSAV